MKRESIIFILAVLGIFVLSGCAAGINPSVDIPNVEGEIAGFWQGLWHGMIVPITFIISLFSDKIEIYEVFNNGGWYNFGFLCGLSISLGGSGHGSSRVRWRREC